MIRVLYFARLREQLNTESEEIEVMAGINNLGALIEHLKCRGDVWQEAFDNMTVMMALNQEMANTETVIHDGDEVAFFPPVTGG